MVLDKADLSSGKKHQVIEYEFFFFIRLDYIVSIFFFPLQNYVSRYLKQDYVNFQLT